MPKSGKKIRGNAERAKTCVVKQAQKDIAREAKTVHTKANFKVGAAFAVAIGAGALMLMTQFMTLGLLTLMIAGGRWAAISTVGIRVMPQQASWQQRRKSS